MATASISGRVVNLAGESLAGATIHLSGGSVYRTTTSASEGAFLFDDLFPGRYRILGECSGYNQQPYGAPPGSRNGIDISVDDGEHVRDLVFKLAPFASISGTVTRDDRSPVAGAHVVAQKLLIARGARSLFPFGFGVTAEDGVYRIDKLAPGPCYVSVERVADPALATPVELAAGAELRGLDLQLRETRGYRVHGKLLPSQFAMVQLLPLDGSNFMRRRDHPHPQPVGQAFEFHEVAPGRYAVQASPGFRTHQGLTTAAAVARILITVTDADLDDLVLHLGPALDIRGRAIIEGVEPLPLLPELEALPPSASASMHFRPAVRPWITLRSTGGALINSPSDECREDGSFHIRNIIPGKYRVNVGGVFPRGAYLKSIYLGDRDVTDAEFELTADPPALRVIFSPHGTEICGIVRDGTGAPLPGAEVLCGAASRGGEPPFRRLFEVSCRNPPRTVITDQKGAFEILNLAPGEYGLECRAGNLLGGGGDLVACGVTLTLHENSREHIDLQALS